MRLHAKQPGSTQKQEGAFLVIALILLIILSSLGIAAVSATSASSRVSVNYSKYMDAENKAQSMAQYALRILATYPAATYPAPATCNSSTSCNVIDSTFPSSGRPVFVWDSGLGAVTLYGASQSNVWWTTNGFAYEATFAGSGNARVVVSLLGVDPSSPYEQTYRIVGYATDSTGIVEATYQLFYTWDGYVPDPGDGTCSGLCNYALCCNSSNSCAGDASSCENGSATYVPPGWTCAAYFETGLGYTTSACSNPVAPP